MESGVSEIRKALAYVEGHKRLRYQELITCGLFRMLGLAMRREAMANSGKPYSKAEDLLLGALEREYEDISRLGSWGADWGAWSDRLNATALELKRSRQAIRARMRTL